jgi:hypothetical protein
MFNWCRVKNFNQSKLTNKNNTNVNNINVSADNNLPRKNTPNNLNTLTRSGNQNKPTIHYKNTNIDVDNMTTHSNKKFVQKMEKLQLDYQNNTLNIQPHYIAQAINLANQAQNYSKKTRAYWRYKKDALNFYYKGSGFSNTKKRKIMQRNVLLGMSIWSLAGLKNINVSGFRALAISVAKIVVSTFISPTAGAKYIDLPIAILQGTCTKFTPKLSADCKNAPTFSELTSKFNTIKSLQKNKNISADINIDTNKDTYIEYKKLQSQFKLRVEHLKYAFKGNYRSIARIIMLAVILILLLTTSGLSLGINIAIIVCGHLLYCLACGLDTYFQNKHHDWMNLQYSDFLKEDIKLIRLEKIQNKTTQIESTDICKNKARKHWSTHIDIQIDTIQSIYAYQMAKLSKKFQKKQLCIKQMQILTEQMHLYQQRRFTELNPNHIIGKCLAHSVIFKQQAIIAGVNKTNDWEQQAAKNLGSSNYSIPFSMVGEPAYYAFHNTEIFTTAKMGGGLMPPLARAMASVQREEVKPIFNIDINPEDIEKRIFSASLKTEHTFNLREIQYVKNKKNQPIIYNITLQHKNNADIAYTAEVMDYAPQSHQFVHRKQRYLSIIKGSWLSAKGFISIPMQLIKLRDL